MKKPALIWFEKLPLLIDAFVFDFDFKNLRTKIKTTERVSGATLWPFHDKAMYIIYNLLRFLVLKVLFFLNFP